MEIKVDTVTPLSNSAQYYKADTKPNLKSLLKNTTSFVEGSDNYVKRKGTGRRLSFSDENGQNLTEVRIFFT